MFQVSLAHGQKMASLSKKVPNFIPEKPLTLRVVIHFGSNNKFQSHWRICSKRTLSLLHKTSEKSTIFCFPGVEKRCLGKEWVNNYLLTENLQNNFC